MESLLSKTRRLTQEPVRQACEHCRRRKVRCENQRPCARCVKSGLNCMTDGLEASEEPQTKRRRSEASPAISEAPDTQWGSSLYLDLDGQVVSSGSTSGLPLMERLGGLHQSQPWDPSPTPLSPERVSNVHVYQTASKSTRPEKSDTDGSPAEPTYSTAAADVLSLCPLDLLNRIVRHHLSVTETMWPVLHHSTFLQLYLDMTRKGETMSPQFGALLMAIAALNSRSMEDPRVQAAVDDARSSGLHYFKLAKDLLQRSENRLNLHYIQASYYLAVFSEGLGKSSGRHLGEAVAIALTTGMHRASDSWNFDEVVKETRKRTFFAIYAFDKASSSLLGRPPMIRLSECNIELPDVEDDDFVFKGGKNFSLLAVNASTQLNAILEQVLFACNAPLRGHNEAATDFLYNVTRDDEIPRRSAILNRAEGLIDEWEAQLPASLRLEENGEIDIQRSRLAVEKNYVRALIARERLVFELRARKNVQTPSSLTNTGLLAKHWSAHIVRAYTRLAIRGQLDPYFGVNHIIHLTFCGHTFLSIMAMHAAFSSEGISDLEMTIGLLQQSSRTYPAALRAADLLRQMGASFHIRLSIPPSLSQPLPWSWIRMVPRVSTKSSPVEVSPLRSPMVLTDEAWLERMASGRPLADFETSSRGDISTLTYPSVDAPWEQPVTFDGAGFADLFDTLKGGTFDGDSLTQLLMSNYAPGDLAD